MTGILSAPTLTDSSLAEARSWIGKPIRVEQWNYEASRDSVRHYAWGIGDDNPLWSDPDYAAGTRYGSIIAPPTFMYGIFDAVVAPGLPDIQWIYSGADWTFYRPVKVGEPITARAELVDAREVSGGTVAKLIVQTGKVTYLDTTGKPVAEALSHCFRVPRANAEGGLRYKERAQSTHDAEALERIEHALLNEYRRGADVLYFEDVEVGSSIPTVVRGPINQLDMTCYYAGAVGTTGYKSTKLRFKYAHLARTQPGELPNNYDPSYYAAAVSPSIGHQDVSVAQAQIGMPNAYDNGPQRIGMMASAVTNWMGDDAELRNISVRLKRPVIFGDVNYFKGKVVAKRDAVGHGRGVIVCELTAENQFGDITAVGTATVDVARKQ